MQQKGASNRHDPMLDQKDAAQVDRNAAYFMFGT